MAIKVNLVIDQGTDYTTDINVSDDNDNPENLTGWSGAAQMRKFYTSATAYPFNVTVQPYGVVTLAANSTVTGSMTAGRYVYDCELTSPSGKVSRLVEGIVTITPQVTR